MRTKSGLRGALLLILAATLQPTSRAAAGASLSPSVLVAHAGGAVGGLPYTNSLEALNGSYARGFRWFEIDFSWTADGELVAAHDWESFRDLFEVSGADDIPTEPEFLRAKSRLGLTQLTLGDVLRWAEAKGDVFIVTDVKENNMAALRKIKARAGAAVRQVIPQAYSYQEYDRALELGYENVILTLYRMKISPPELLRFAETRKPYAITMHSQVVGSGLAERLKRKGITVYAHTVNDGDAFEALRSLGVFGIYTDAIAPR
jgi:glycerophosphoryl diester phosphodiesterase